jgi:SNF2 family DNA or RNA helicase
LVILKRFAARQLLCSVYTHALQKVSADIGKAADAGRIVDAGTDIWDTRIWKKFYRFQTEGVIGAIDKPMRFGGCSLADSVGFGKTFEALAVVKYFELRNEDVLALTPSGCEVTGPSGRRTILVTPLRATTFAYEILNHTDLSREGGYSGDIDLEHINWGNYCLVVIDELHNFRNHYVAAQGTALGREGRVFVAHDGRDFWIGGESVAVISGTLTL